MTPGQRFTARVWLTLWALTRPRRHKRRRLPVYGVVSQSFGSPAPVNDADNARRVIEAAQRHKKEARRG